MSLWWVVIRTRNKVLTTPGNLRALGSVRPHYTGQILKRSFISTARSTVHTISSRKRSFSKTFIKAEEFENASFSFWRKHFENGAFEKRHYSIITM